MSGFLSLHGADGRAVYIDPLAIRVVSECQRSTNDYKNGVRSYVWVIQVQCDEGRGNAFCIAETPDRIVAAVDEWERKWENGE